MGKGSGHSRTNEAGRPRVAEPRAQLSEGRATRGRDARRPAPGRASLRAHDPDDFFLHQLGEEAESDAHRQRPAAPPSRRRAAPQAPPAREPAAPPARPRPARPLRLSPSRRFLLRSWTDRLVRSPAERTRPEGPPSSSTSYGTTSVLDVVEIVEAPAAPSCPSQWRPRAWPSMESSAMSRRKKSETVQSVTTRSFRDASGSW